MTDQKQYLTDKAAILARMATSWAALQAAVAGLDPETIARPGTWGEWSLKDLHAHLAYWNESTMHYLEGLVSGEWPPAAGGTGATTDEINENVYRANRTQSLADLQHALHVSYLAVRTAVKSVPALTYTEEQQPEPIRQKVAEDTYLHYEEHLADVEQSVSTSTTTMEP